MKDILQVRIVSPKQDIFFSPAVSVSSINSAGKFDILPQHANFITLINNSPIVVRLPSGKNVTFKFPLAIIYLVNNQVNIYTNLQIETQPGN